jgi:hypothetical protein
MLLFHVKNEVPYEAVTRCVCQSRHDPRKPAETGGLESREDSHVRNNLLLVLFIRKILVLSELTTSALFPLYPCNNCKDPFPR